MADPTPADQRFPQPVSPIPLHHRDQVTAPLPAPLTSFVGREREVEQFVALLRRPDVRLATLTGPGGVGKTRLALRVAEELAAAFGDGVAVVSLAPIAGPNLVGPTVARALGVREASDRPIGERLAAALRDRHLLLLLDNFEQVVKAAPLVVELLAGCPRLKVLATSREPLRLSAERVVAVPPLALPDLDRPAAELAASEAVRLFVARAQAARADFVERDADLPAVAAICRRLDGLPLAIELAAARVAHLPPATLLARLDRRLPLLTGGARDLPARQRTMAATIAWSHDLLAPAEQALFRRLAVFAGGCTLEGAEAVAGAPGDRGLDVLDGVASLVAKSLLRQGTGPDGGPRYWMLETAREFALERLEASGEADAARRAHAAFFVALAERADPAIWGGPEHKPWLDRLEAELANLRAALAWLEGANDRAGFLRLAAALGGLWHYRSYRVEGRGWVRRALARDDGTAPAARATALVKLALLDRDVGGVLSAAFVEEAIALRRALGYDLVVGRNLMLLATMLDARTDAARIERAVTEATAIFERLGDPKGLAFVRAREGMAAVERGDADRARDLLMEALGLVRREGTPYDISSGLLALGGVEADRGDIAAAAGHYAECLRLWDETGSRECIVAAVAGTGRLAAAGERPDAAVRLLGAAAALGEELGYAASPQERTRSERAASIACAALGEQAFAAAWAAGAALPFDGARADAEALLAALAERPDPTEAGAPAAPGGLSPREVDVVRLIAAGRSNREIADALFVSPSTAISHVSNILAKLGLDSRAAVAAWAVRHGLA